jgi:hypothetical protein
MRNLIIIVALFISMSANATDSLQVRKLVYVKNQSYPYVIQYRYKKPSKCNITVYARGPRGETFVGKTTGTLKDRPEDILFDFIKEEEDDR